MHYANNTPAKRIGPRLKESLSSIIVEKPVTLVVRTDETQRRIVWDLDQRNILAVPPLETRAKRPCRFECVEHGEPSPAFKKLRIRARRWLPPRGLREKVASGRWIGGYEPIERSRQCILLRQKVYRQATVSRADPN